MIFNSFINNLKKRIGGVFFAENNYSSLLYGVFIIHIFETSNFKNKLLFYFVHKSWPLLFSIKTL